MHIYIYICDLLFWITRAWPLLSNSLGSKNTRANAINVSDYIPPL